MTRSTARNGFSLIELMVTITIIGIMMALAAPSFSGAATKSRERGVPQKFIQDFTWARGAAGAADASVLSSSASGAPTVEVILNSDCTWTTKIQGTATTTFYTDATHTQSSSPAGLTMACTSPVSNGTPALTFPVTFTFMSTGFLATGSSGGNVTFTGGSGQTFPLTILQSGSILRTSSAS